MEWFYLALVAPLLFAVVALIDDNLIHHIYKGPYAASIISGLFGLLPAISLIFLDTQPVEISTVLAGTIAGFLTVFYLFFYFRALELESPSVVIAMFSLSPVLIPFFARYFLGEQLTNVQLTGFVLVVLASFGLALTEVKKLKFSAALVPMLVAVIAAAVSSMLSKYTYTKTNFYTGYMYFAAGMGLGGLYFLLLMFFQKTHLTLKELKKNTRKIIMLLALGEIIAITADFAINLALSRGSVSLVEAVRGTEPMYVLLIALFFYRFSPKHFREAVEGGLIKKFTLMSVIVVGLYLISTAA